MDTLLKMFMFSRVDRLKIVDRVVLDDGHADFQRYREVFLVRSRPDQDNRSAEENNRPVCPVDRIA